MFCSACTGISGNLAKKNKKLLWACALEVDLCRGSAMASGQEPEPVLSSQRPSQPTTCQPVVVGRDLRLSRGGVLASVISHSNLAVSVL